MIKSKKVTLKEVAAAVNLAVPTVSQILNGRKNFCSEEQCRKVRETAREMGYITNIGYRIMTGMETHTVGIMVASNTQMQEFHIRELILELTARLSDQRWAAFCNVLPLDAEKSVAKIREFLGRGVEKFIFIGLPFGHEEIFSLLEKNNIPFIGNRKSMSCFCRSNSVEARQKLFSHVREKSQNNFRIFWWFSDRDMFSANWSQFLPDLQSLLVDLPKADKDYYADTFTIGYEAIKNLLTQNPELKGAVFPNDAYALGAAQWLWENKIENFSLAGFNGDRQLLRFPYPVSTGIQPVSLLADEMADFIKTNTVRQKWLPVELILY